MPQGIYRDARCLTVLIVGLFLSNTLRKVIPVKMKWDKVTNCRNTVAVRKYASTPTHLNKLQGTKHPFQYYRVLYVGDEDNI